jgi:hypothetical protein
VGQWAGVVIGGWCRVREWGGGGSWAEDVSGVFSRYRKIENLLFSCCFLGAVSAVLDGGGIHCPPRCVSVSGRVMEQACVVTGGVRGGLGGGCGVVIGGGERRVWVVNRCS